MNKIKFVNKKYNLIKKINKIIKSKNLCNLIIIVNVAIMEKIWKAKNQKISIIIMLIMLKFNKKMINLNKINTF